jgi:hypothetical protein
LLYPQVNWPIYFPGVFVKGFSDARASFLPGIFQAKKAGITNKGSTPEKKTAF